MGIEMNQSLGGQRVKTKGKEAENKRKYRRETEQRKKLKGDRTESSRLGLSQTLGSTAGKDIS